MSKRSHLKPVVAALGVAVATVAPAIVQAAENPFGLSGTGTGLIAAKGLSVLEGKCGEGKCGSLRVRKMMDADDNGTITRQEYVDWGTRISNREFDKFTSGNSVSPDKVFNSFEEWERLSQES